MPSLPNSTVSTNSKSLESYIDVVPIIANHLPRAVSLGTAANMGELPHSTFQLILVLHCEYALHYSVACAETQHEAGHVAGTHNCLA